MKSQEESDVMKLEWKDEVRGRDYGSGWMDGVAGNGAGDGIGSTGRLMGKFELKMIMVSPCGTRRRILRFISSSLVMSP